jgi:hypothetical protein
MKQAIATVVFVFGVMFTPLAAAGDRQDARAGRQSLYCVNVSNGSSLEMSTSLASLNERASTRVSIALHHKESSGKENLFWRVDQFTMLDYHPETSGYYAMVKVMGDRLFVFSMWNAHYCLIDTRTGRVLKSGEGDDVLKEYGGLVPLKLSIKTSATFEFLTGPAATQYQKDRLESDRTSPAVIRREAVPALKHYRFYIIQYEKPVSQRKPLFVIAWKATTPGSSAFDFRPPVTGIVIHEHLMRPLPMKKAVYMLQPDYSLQRLDLTEKEVADLFSHITDSELRKDERVAAITEKEIFDDKDFDRLDKLRDDLAVFPPSPLWEKRVSPHLKTVVER